MKEEKIVTAKTVEEAMAQAVALYGAEDVEITYQILEMPKRGFLGIGAVPAKIKVTIGADDDVELLKKELKNAVKSTSLSLDSGEADDVPAPQKPEQKRRPAPAPKKSEPPKPDLPKPEPQLIKQTAPQASPIPAKTSPAPKQIPINRSPAPKPLVKADAVLEYDKTRGGKPSQKNNTANVPAAAINTEAAKAPTAGNTPVNAVKTSSDATIPAPRSIPVPKPLPGKRVQPQNNAPIRPNLPAETAASRPEITDSDAPQLQRQAQPRPRTQKPVQPRTQPPRSQPPKPTVQNPQSPKPQLQKQPPRQRTPRPAFNAEGEAAYTPRTRRTDETMFKVTREEIETAVAFINELLANMSLDCTAVHSAGPDADFDAVNENDGTGSTADRLRRIDISGPDSGALIGHHGDTLDALQYLVNLAVNRREGERREYVKIIIDVENYRAKREETLRSLARRMASRALKYQRSMTLEPMNPYERRIIHSEIQNVEGVSTHSVGSDESRRIIITVDGVESEYRPRAKTAASPRTGAGRPDYDKNRRRRKPDTDAEASVENEASTENTVSETFSAETAIPVESAVPDAVSEVENPSPMDDGGSSL